MPNFKSMASGDFDLATIARIGLSRRGAMDTYMRKLTAPLITRSLAVALSLAL
jgi:hypothetical protein